MLEDVTWTSTAGHIRVTGMLAAGLFYNFQAKRTQVSDGLGLIAVLPNRRRVA